MKISALRLQYQAWIHVGQLVRFVANVQPKVQSVPQMAMIFFRMFCIVLSIDSNICLCPIEISSMMRRSVFFFKENLCWVLWGYVAHRSFMDLQRYKRCPVFINVERLPWHPEMLQNKTLVIHRLWKKE